jgi:hypothetical protein
MNAPEGAQGSGVNQVLFALKLHLYSETEGKQQLRFTTDRVDKTTPSKRSFMGTESG